jgi:hypothetical protein
VNALRKPRPDARLKNLPLDKQAQIAEMLRATPLRAAVAQLRSQGVETSRQALGRFFAWWNERQREESLLKVAAEAVAKLRKENPEITTGELADRAKQAFLLHAIAMARDDFKGGVKLWAKLERRLSI